jgi:hypothetical protein
MTLNIFNEISLNLVEDQLQVKGLSSLPEDRAQKIREYIRQHRGEIMEQLRGPGLRIEPMEFCLHGKPCRHLQAPGGTKPICKRSGKPVFDMQQCPEGVWFSCRS